MAKVSRATLQARQAAEAWRENYDRLRAEVDPLIPVVLAVADDGPAPKVETAIAAAIRIIAAGSSKRAELEQANTALGEELQRQLGAVKALQATNTKSLEERDRARNEARDTQQENNHLRDELHRLGIDRARLEGQLERVHEFDPVTERQHYRDGLSSIEDNQRNGAGAFVSNGRGTVEWYRRF